MWHFVIVHTWYVEQNRRIKETRGCYTSAGCWLSTKNATVLQWKHGFHLMRTCRHCPESFLSIIHFSDSLQSVGMFIFLLYYLHMVSCYSESGCNTCTCGDVPLYCFFSGHNRVPKRGVFRFVTPTTLWHLWKSSVAKGNPSMCRSSFF